MNPVPLIHEFTDADVAPANALTNHYIIHTVVHFGYAPATDEQFADLWRKGRERFPWLAAEIDGRFAGYAKAAVWRERDAYARTVETGIYITRESQGRGVGKALYAALLDRVQARGFRTAIGGITLPNAPSVRLHETLGFRHVGDYEAVGYKFDKWHDVGFWQIDLTKWPGTS